MIARRWLLDRRVRGGVRGAARQAGRGAEAAAGVVGRRRRRPDRRRRVVGRRARLPAGRLRARARFDVPRPPRLELRDLRDAGDELLLEVVADGEGLSREERGVRSGVAAVCVVVSLCSREGMSTLAGSYFFDSHVIIAGWCGVAA